MTGFMNHGQARHPIFLITHEFHPKHGGIATFTEEIARAAAGLGHDVEVWAQSAQKTAEKSWPFHIKRLPVKGTHGLLCQAGLARQLIAQRRRLRYATVYLPEPGPMLAMMFLQYFKTFRPHRLVLTFHGSEILRFHDNPILRKHTRRLIRNASRISTLTHYTQKLLCERFPEAADKTFLTPGALRADFAVVDTHAPHELKKRLVVLTVGRLHPRKGQLITLQALQALAPRFRSQIEYWIAGSGTRAPHYEKSLRLAASRAGFPVRFLGNLPDDELDQVYDHADIFALTSIDYRHSVEGFGLVYLEAAAHGLPVVAHAVGGVPEAVMDGVTGFLIPPRHPAQLAAAFEKLISDAALRQKLGSAGRDWARRNCWEHSARLLFNPAPGATGLPFA
jgi:glycosyltransferase involved in cell wall biosynthesis